MGKIDHDQMDATAREALQPFENSAGENPYTVQRDLQEVMQHDVGIVRDESEMRSALDHLKKFWERAARVGVTGNRDFNPGWHTALDLKESADGFRSDYARRTGAKGKSWRTISRGLSREGRTLRQGEHDDSQGEGWNDGNPTGTASGDAGLFETDY